MISGTRAQSSVIGVVILTGFVVLAVSAIGAVWVDDVSERAEGSGPLLDTDVNVTDANVTIGHRMGEPVAYGDITVILRNGTSREEFRLSSASVADGDGDGAFEPSEVVVRSHDLGGRIEVLLIHDPSNAVVHRERFELDDGR